MKTILSFFAAVFGILLFSFFTVNAYAAVSKAKVVITTAVGNVGTDIKETKEQISQYMKQHPNVEIKLNIMPNSSSETFGTYLQFAESKSSDVDIFRVDNVWVGDLAPNLLDLNKYDFKELTGSMFKNEVENNIVDGKLVAIPWFTNISILAYRKDLLEKYNLPVPQTWDELTKTAYMVQQKERASGNSDFVGFVWQGNAYEGLTCNALEWICSNDGGVIVSNDKKVTLNNKNAIDALRRASMWIGTISPKGVLSMDEEKSRAVFQSGNALFIRSWPYVYTLGNDSKSPIRGKIDFCALPEGKNGKRADITGGWSLAVNKYSKHPDIAADVVKFFASKEQQKFRAVQEAGQPPTIKSLYTDKDVLKSKPYFGKLYKIFEYAFNRPATVLAPNYTKVSTLFYKGVYSILNKEKTPDVGVDEMTKQISKITGFPIAK
jgi:trehalose/maltose transport system substrate-binding protein